MSVPATTFFNIDKLRRHDGPALFLGGGFLAGLLVFAVWLSVQPDDGKQVLRARGNGVVGANGMQTPGGGVLDEITGDLRAGAPAESPRDESYFFGEGEAETQAEAGEEVDGELQPDERFDHSYVQDADAMAVGEDVGVTPDEQGALTDSLLDPVPAPAVAAGPGPGPGAALSSWYVEVEVAPGQVQMLQLNAESPEHALAILRDFRGDPHVLRGPSPEPLP
jgi:hypothetical protein